MLSEFHPLAVDLAFVPAIMSDDKVIVFEVFYGVSSPWALLGAPRVEEIGKKYNLTVHLRPIVIIEANGGIPLRTRTEARQDCAWGSLQVPAAR